MRKLKLFTAIGILFVIVTGTLSHFLYGWTGNNPVIGLFAPVNESIWEHMKLLFFPMLLYSFLMLFLFRRKYPCITSSLYLGILSGTFLIPILYYAYVFILGKDIFFLDIAIFIVSILIAFLLSYKLASSCRLQPFAPFLLGLVCILFACFIVFTYHPPAARIFENPSGALTYNTPH